MLTKMLSSIGAVPGAPLASEADVANDVLSDGEVVEVLRS